MSTEILRYLRLIFVPNVMKRKMKQPKAHDQTNASKLCCDCNCTESYTGSDWKLRTRRNSFDYTIVHTLSHSTLRNANSRRVKINAPDTMTSTDRCGPRLCKLKNKSFPSEYCFHYLWDKKWCLTFKYERTLSHVLMFRTLFKRKCGNSDFRARLDDVKCENSFAYKNLWNENGNRKLVD